MILVYFIVGSTSSGSAFVIAPNLGNYLRVDLTLKTTPPPIFLDPVYRSGSTILLYYLKTYFDINKSLRNLTPFRQHVLLLYILSLELM